MPLCVCVCVCVCVCDGGAAGRQATMASYRALKKKHYIYTMICFLHEDFSASINPLHIAIKPKAGGNRDKKSYINGLIHLVTVKVFFF